MLGKRTRPAIGKLPGEWSGNIDCATSPRSPLGYKIQYPKGLNSYDQGGIGLGIVIALDKPTNVGGQGDVLRQYAIVGQISNLVSSILVESSTKNDQKESNKIDSGKFRGVMKMKEEFTNAKCQGPNKFVTTNVYHDHFEFGKISQGSDVFCDRDSLVSESKSDFLSSCHLCWKTLHGKDIYMYRGEKAYCSAECRERQIGIDERKEQCRSEASKSGDVSGSPCTYTTRGQIFFSTGIVAV